MVKASVDRLGVIARAAETPGKPCPCATCRHLGKVGFCEWFVTRHEQGKFVPEVDLESDIAKRFHEYAPHLRKLSGHLPERATRAAYRAKETNAIRMIRAWHDQTDEFAERDDESNMLVMSGPRGTGKTVAAVWLALHRLADAPPVFMTSPELARKPRYGPERDELLGSTTLILDDLGTECPNDKFGVEKFAADFDELVDRMYQASATLVITTNLTAAEFKKRYGARVVDRLAECGAWIPCTGSSLRTQK